MIQSYGYGTVRLRGLARVGVVVCLPRLPISENANKNTWLRVGWCSEAYGYRDSSARKYFCERNFHS